MTTSYTRRAYVDFTDILADEVGKIRTADLTDDELLLGLETVQNIAVRIAKVFKEDNPKGFDEGRFFNDSGLNLLSEK